MKILIAGATGFIGKELVKTLSNNHHIIVIGRNQQRLEKCFPQAAIHKLTWDNFTNYDAKQLDCIINLSGSNIGAKRWTAAIKKELIESRTGTNKKLIDWLIKQNAFPHYYCANAVGIYGAHVSHTHFDENYPTHAENPNDFLKEIGLAWEQSLTPAIDHGIKVTILRFGVVLKKGEGMLKKLELPFSLGLGSVLGNGDQVISWIHHEDLVNSILFLLDKNEVTGPINITSPHPVTQKEFAIQFAKVLNRPLLFKTPEFMIKTMFGEMGEYLLLKGQYVIPTRLNELGFKFIYPKIEGALKTEYTT